MRSEHIRLGVDVGGSSIKGALVDLAAGELLANPIRIPAPKDFAFEEVVSAITEIARRLDHGGAIGVGFPAVTVRGVISSPPTALAHPGWLGRDLEAALRDRQGAPIRVTNDADAAGIAEMRFGAGRGREGVVWVFTLGTGVGSALFHEGVLVPNAELGKLTLPGDDRVAELRVASRLKVEEKLSWQEWGTRLADYLEQIELLFAPDLVILGGGVSEEAEHFLPWIRTRAEVLPAQLRNDAGIVGAACLAETL